jgi:hypothetical protein
VVNYGREMSLANKLRLIKTLRETGMSDADILREVLGGEYGSERRRKLVVEWGVLLGLSSTATSLKGLAIKLRESLANKAVIFGRSASKFANLCDPLSAIHRTKALINRACQLLL